MWFRRLMKRLTSLHNKVWCGERAPEGLGSVIMMGMTFAVADMGCDDRDYDNWLTTPPKRPRAWTTYKQP